MHILNNLENSLITLDIHFEIITHICVRNASIHLLESIVISVSNIAYIQDNYFILIWKTPTTVLYRLTIFTPMFFFIHKLPRLVCYPFERKKVFINSPWLHFHHSKYGISGRMGFPVLYFCYLFIKLNLILLIGSTKLHHHRIVWEASSVWKPLT